MIWLLSAALAAPPDAEPPDRSAPTPVCHDAVGSLPVPAALRDDPRLDDPHLVVVEKAMRRVSRYRDGALVEVDERPACWWAGLAADDDGDAWTGTKTRRGDRKTPEGFYRTSDKPWSSFYGAIAVHYPDAADARAGARRGTITTAQATAIAEASAAGRKPDQTTRMGGEILLHGGGGRSDWTLGCIGLDDADIDTLRATLPDDQRTWVLILP